MTSQWFRALRPNGRWSLWHRLSHGKHTICGWEYDDAIQIENLAPTERPLGLLACRECATGSSERVEDIRLSYSNSLQPIPGGFEQGEL